MNARVDLDERAVRALTASMSVLEDVGRARDAVDLYLVVSDSGRSYLVDRRERRCECDDHFYQGVECAHLHRVDFATGARAVPAWVDRDAVDEQLGRHVSGPVFAGDVDADADGGIDEVRA